MSTKSFSIRVIVVCVLILVAAAMSACSTQQVVPEKRTQIAQITRLTDITVAPLKRAQKPELVVREIDGQKVPTLNKAGMQQLITLYKSEGHAVEVANSALDVAKSAVDERNRLLALAQAEEELGNALRKQLAETQNAYEKEKLYTEIELNATRLIAVLALALAL